MYPAGVPNINVRQVKLENGLSLRVLDGGAQPASARAADVLLVHGWGGCVYSFAETIPALVHAGHRVVAFDLPGHGLSAKPVEPWQYSTGALLEAIVGVVKAMRMDRFTYVGHSMGGLLGLRLATGGMHAIERLVLISSPGLTGSPIIGPLKVISPRVIDRVMPRFLTRGVIKGVLNVAFGTPDRPTERDIDEYWALTQFDEYAWACRACIHRVDWSRVPATKLRSLRIPVLVITGGRDRLVRGVARRARLIPTARVVPIREGGHLVMQECATRANAEILAFLRET